MTTVKDLLDALQGLPEDMKVFQAVDEEGNGYRPVCEVAKSHYDILENEAIHPDDLDEYLNDDDDESRRLPAPDQVQEVAVIWPY